MAAGRGSRAQESPAFEPRAPGGPRHLPRVTVAVGGHGIEHQVPAFCLAQKGVQRLTVAFPWLRVSFMCFLVTAAVSFRCLNCPFCGSFTHTPLFARMIEFIFKAIELFRNHTAVFSTQSVTCSPWFLLPCRAGPVPRRCPRFRQNAAAFTCRVQAQPFRALALQPCGAEGRVCTTLCPASANAGCCLRSQSWRVWVF